jgi:transmembrane sensor
LNVDYNDIDTLIGKDLSGEISAEERVVLNNWIELSVDNRAYYNHFKTLFDQSLNLKHQEVFDKDAAWGKLKEKIKIRSQGKKTIQLAWKIAASIFVLITIGSLFYQNFFKPQQETTLAATEQPTEKLLPDGTGIFMNKNTSVEYAYDPIKKIRKTKLKGEAYFNIAEKDKQEFLLEVDGLLIKDIGTSFNVKAYPGSDTVEVYVESGEVIFYTALDSGLHLKERETGFYNKVSNTFSKLTQRNENILAYKTQIFVFDNTRLSEVVEVINEVYDIKLKLENKELENCRITVTFRHETIEMIAEVIAETLSLTPEKTDNEITLKGNGCRK